MLKLLIDSRILYDFKGLKQSLKTLETLKEEMYPNMEKIIDFYSKSLKPIIHSKLFGKKFSFNFKKEHSWKSQNKKDTFIPFLTSKEDYIILQKAYKNEAKFVKFFGEKSDILDLISNEMDDVLIISEKDYKEDIQKFKTFLEENFPNKFTLVLMNYDTKSVNISEKDLIFDSFTDGNFLEFLNLSKNCIYKESKINKIQQKYCVDSINEPEDTEELYLWDNIIEFDKELILPKGTIIKGKQLGRTIGIPTANLGLESKLLADYDMLPGVYYGTGILSNSGDIEGIEGAQFPIVASIGTNRHLNEKKVAFEFMILHDFKGREFYGAELQVRIMGFVRPESSFWNFDMFIRAMECDIEISKIYIKKYALL